MSNVGWTSRRYSDGGIAMMVALQLTTLRYNDGDIAELHRNAVLQRYRSTTTHGHIGFVEVASVLFSNWFAQQQKTIAGARRKLWQCLLLCYNTHAHTQVKILGDGTQNLTTVVTNRLLNELGITTTSFAPTGAVAGGGVVGVVT
ncbi:unnamed protein product [Sphagnum balticum]